MSIVRTPDHISVITEERETIEDELEVVGSAIFCPDYYPLIIDCWTFVKIMQETSGEGTIVFWDVEGGESLGQIEFSDREWQNYKLNLSGIPTYGDNGIAEVEFQLKTDGSGTAKIKVGSLEVF